MCSPRGEASRPTTASTRKGRFVIYPADQDTENVTELYRADIKVGGAKEPGATLKVSSALEENESVIGG